MNCVFIYNPKSGNGKVIKRLEYIKKELLSVYEKVDIYESKSADDIINKVKEFSLIYDRIIFAGGDGTFNNVITGLSECDIRPTLGYIPVGTCCDIGKNLGISKRIKKAVDVIKKGYVISHDVGKVNDQYFVYVVGIGACTGTSYTTKQHSKKLLGRIAYVKNGLSEFFKTPLRHVRIINENNIIDENSPLLLILNSYSVGGIRFNKHSTLNDGKFDVVVIKNGLGKGRWNIIEFFLRGLLGIRKKPHAITFSASKLEVKLDDEFTWCVDGEAGPKGSVKIENLHNHFKIIAPRKK